jgi:hypothetical protein
MADGTTKPIREVRIGDEVTATDPTTGRTGARQVTDLITGTGQKHLVELRVGDGTIVATEGHPVWVADRHAWVEAGDLAAGQRIEATDGRVATVTATRSWTEYRQVHNLTVDGLHTYVVVAGATDLLVHNADDPCKNKAYPSGTPKKPVESVGAEKSNSWYLRLRAVTSVARDIPPVVNGTASTTVGVANAEMAAGLALIELTKAGRAGAKAIGRGVGKVKGYIERRRGGGELPPGDTPELPPGS